jgi:hypothetical protein
MKNSICYYLIFLLIIISCKRVQESSTSSTLEKTIIDASEYPCLDSDYIMYKETAAMWEKSWAGLYTNPQGSSSISPILQFSNANIDALSKKITGSELIGMRVYYILLEEDEEIPSLAMVNLESCKKDQECDDCVLISRIDGKQEFISSDSVNILKGYWEKLSDKYFDHTPVYGYNYSWPKIKELMDISENAVSNTSEAAINIKYGLHTLGPLDTELYTDPDSTSKNSTGVDVTGSIVYANIIYPHESQRSTADPEFDFAKPCPRFCPE